MVDYCNTTKTDYTLYIKNGQPKLSTYPVDCTDLSSIDPNNYIRSDEFKYSTVFKFSPISYDTLLHKVKYTYTCNVGKTPTLKSKIHTGSVLIRRYSFLDIF